MVPFPWQPPWLQSLFVKNQIHLGLARNRHASHIVVTLLIRLPGVGGTWLRQKLGISILINTGPAAKLSSWQQHHSCHFVSFVNYLPLAKFEEHCSNISRDILDAVFYHFSYTIVNGGDWLWSPANIKGANKNAKIYVGRSTTLHNLLFFPHTL